jgi:hypothetical protein
MNLQEVLDRVANPKFYGQKVEVEVKQIIVPLRGVLDHATTTHVVLRTETPEGIIDYTHIPFERIIDIEREK